MCICLKPAEVVKAILFNTFREPNDIPMRLQTPSDSFNFRLCDSIHYLNPLHSPKKKNRNNDIAYTHFFFKLNRSTLFV